MTAESDGALAARIAAEAGDVLLALQQSGDFEGRALGAEGDRIANDLLMKALRAARPDDALLSEEEKDNAVRLSASRVWIVDPLDGTREYREGRTDWAVHVGLAIDGKAQAGAVALPGLGQIFSSETPAPVAPANAPLVMLVSRTRRPRKR